MVNGAFSVTPQSQLEDSGPRKVVAAMQLRRFLDFLGSAEHLKHWGLKCLALKSVDFLESWYTSLEFGVLCIVDIVSIVCTAMETV